MTTVGIISVVILFLLYVANIAIPLLLFNSSKKREEYAEKLLSNNHAVEEKTE